MSTLLASLRPKRLPNADNEASLNILLQTAEIVLAARLRARVLLHHNATKRFAPGKRMIPKSGVRFSDKIMRKKEGGEAPKGACQPFPRNINKRCRSSMSRRGCAPNRGAPAFRRYAAALAGTPIPAQLQAMLPGTWTAHDANIMRGESRRTLPALSCPSPVTAPHASAVIPKGMMPKAAPERVASPRGGTALAPLPKVPSRRRLSMSEIFWM